MRVLITGASGLVGRPTATAFVDRGHEVAALTRRGVSLPGVTSYTGDLTTGAGVASALTGVDCVVDCANIVSMSRAKTVRYFDTTTRRLGSLGAAAGVKHHVVLGIVNSNVVPYPYYAGKQAQERAALDGPVPATVLRATQFHEFAGQVLGVLKVGRWSFMPDMLIQPIAAAEVGRALVEVAETGPSGRVPDIAGPREERLADMARRLLAHRGERRAVVTLPVPGKMGRALRGGGQLPGPDAMLRGPTFDDWLATLP
jgi:uncharacterized protein YbjT (DUF2867 family)